MARAWTWTLVVLFSLLASSAGALPCGDLDDDAEVDADDGLLLRQHLAELTALSPLGAARCDVIADGSNGPPATPTCSLVDAVVVLRAASARPPGVSEICAGGVPPDPTSVVETTSACLTLGSGAQAAVVVTLENLASAPLVGANVEMTTDAGTLTEVTSLANMYWAILTPPASGTDATVSIEANGVPLATSPVIDFEDPLADVDGGAGGCPADGNLRVTVVNEAGASLAGAFVMVGQAEQLTAFTTTFGAAPSGPNTAITNGSGVAEFRDFDTNLDGPLTVTAAAVGREYLSFVDVDAADMVVPLAQVAPVIPTSTYTGTVSPLPAPANDPVEFATVIPDTTIDRLARFDVASLFGDNECYVAGGAAGNLVVPTNFYVPQQCAVQFIVCLQTLPQNNWSLPLEGGSRLLFAMRGAAPISVLTGGPIEDILPNAFDFLNATGVTAVSVVPPTGANIVAGVSNNFTAPNVGCAVTNAPANSNVFCVTGGDFDSGAFPSMTTGEGRLFVMGLDAGIAPTPPAALNLTATSLVNSGGFAGIEYLGGAIAFWDEANTNAPPGTALGSTVVFDRSNASFSGAGGAMAFSSFFPIRLLARTSRDFDLAPLPGVPHPVAHYTRSEVEQVITETYTACLANDSTRTRRRRYWTVLAPGDADGFTLPTPPPTWPRAALGGDLAGLVDTATTPENDALVWTNTTVHEGLNPTFDYDRVRLFTFRSFVTHASTNEVPY